MSVRERLVALDRRVGFAVQPAEKAYDAPAPWWLTHGWLLGPLMMPLVFFAGPPSQHPWRVLVVFLGVIGAWVASAVVWTRRHRICVEVPLPIEAEALFCNYPASSVRHMRDSGPGWGRVAACVRRTFGALHQDRIPWLLYLLFGVAFAARSVYHLFDGFFGVAVLVGLLAALNLRAAYRRRRGESVSLWGGGK